jgi:hypothetical protein
MGIDAQLEDESGVKIQLCGDPKSYFARLLAGRDLSSTICLRFIDPYGDTVFNRAQSTVLLEELQSLRGNADTDTRKYIDTAIKFARLASRKPHLYVRFVGD